MSIPTPITPTRRLPAFAGPVPVEAAWSTRGGAQVAEQAVTERR